MKKRLRSDIDKEIDKGNKRNYDKRNYDCYDDFYDKELE